jgi:hypothetical protein
MERHAAQAPALRERDLNFRHFRSFLILAHLVLYELSIDLKLYHRVLNTFLR